MGYCESLDRLRQSINEFLIKLGLVIKIDKVVDWMAEMLGQDRI